MPRCAFQIGGNKPSTLNGVPTVRFLLFFATLFGAYPAWAAPALIDLKAAGPWKVDYSEAACLLSRPFTAPDGGAYQAELTFQPMQVDVWLRLRNGEKPPRRDSGKTLVEVDGIKIADDIHFNIFGSPEGGTTREYWLRQIHRFSAMKRSLLLDAGKRGHFKLATDGFQAAARAIDSCMDDLHRSLGIDPAVIRTIATAPEGSSLSFGEFPTSSSPLHITLLYWVTETGRVENCRVLKPSGNATFDKAICARLEARGRFKPAKDASGKAIRAPVYEDLNLRRERFYISS